MSGEAEHFANYILDFDRNREEYNEISCLCRDVLGIMDEIKIKAGINYPD